MTATDPASPADAGPGRVRSTRRLLTVALAGVPTVVGTVIAGRWIRRCLSLRRRGPVVQLSFADPVRQRRGAQGSIVTVDFIVSSRAQGTAAFPYVVTVDAGPAAGSAHSGMVWVPSGQSRRVVARLPRPQAPQYTITVTLGAARGAAVPSPPPLVLSCGGSGARSVGRCRVEHRPRWRCWRCPEPVHRPRF